MKHENLVTINQDRCTGCGLCTTVCPIRCIALVGGRSRIIAPGSISCGHCEAVCPAQAIRVENLDDSVGKYATFTADKGWMAPGEYDIQQLVRLMASRRSCRSYTNTPVKREQLEDLVKIGVTAPSGSNAQRWAFTILPTRASLDLLTTQILKFFRSLNRRAGFAPLRLALKMVGKRALDDYYHKYYETIHDGIAAWEKKREDRLFHGAPAALIVSSRPGASCPAEDALLATQNILLGAHSMGLGTCLIGFAVAAMKQDPKIKKTVGIPADETVHSVITVGYSEETYRVVTRRKPLTLRYFDV
jgi:nitroreductase/NAD-dependent dihydropyrimidine dehydrogenase PreA subunit